MLEILSDYVLPVFVIVAIAVQARLILVLSTKNKTVPPIFRVIILHILASHIGVSVFGLSRWFIYYVGPSELKEEFCACKIARYALVVTDYTCWIANCMLTFFHSLIRFFSIWRPIQYETYLTDYHVNNGPICSSCYRYAVRHWGFVNTISASRIRFGAKDRASDPSELVACILAVATTLTYLITLAYWKFVKKGRMPIPIVISRTAFSSFLVSSMDIFGNIYALYYFITIQPTSKYFKRQEFSLNCTTIRQHQEGEILQITFQLREIMFPILLIVLFRKVRCLFISKNAYIVLKRGGTQKSMETAHL